MSDLNKFEVCLRAIDKAEKALQRDDFGSALDWVHAAISGAIRIAEHIGDIPKNRRPRRLSTRSRRKSTPPLSRPLRD